MDKNLASDDFLNSRRRLLLGLLALTIPLPISRISRAAAQITFGLVGLWLLQGAVAYVGGKVLGKILGDPTIRDVRVWILAAVDELKNFVSSELKIQLDKQVLNKMQSDLEGINENLYHYASLSKENQITNRYLLEHSDTFTASLVPLSLRFDQSFFVATVAIAYRLMVLNSLYLLDKDAGHIKSARRSVDHALTQLSVTRDRIAYNISPSSQFDVSCKTYRDREEHYSITDNDIYACVGRRNGKPITRELSVLFRYCRGFDLSPCEDEGTDFRKQINNQMKSITMPLQRKSDEFLKLANDSIFKIVECYTVMSESVGETYRLPSEAVPILSTEPVVVPQYIEMPGAVVK